MGEVACYVRVPGFVRVYVREPSLALPKVGGKVDDRPRTGFPILLYQCHHGPMYIVLYCTATTRIPEM